MKTAIHGGAIRKLSAKGYAGGGLIGAFQRITGIGESPEKKAYREQAAAELAAEAAAKNAPKPPAADNALGNYAAGTAMQQREKAAGLKNGGAISGPKGAIRAMANGGMAQKKSVEGAKLKGPGTPTSDSIPATVVDTGEPIKVATGERIVSGSQGQELTREAKAQGYKSLDHKLESMTGKPVGPTIQYQKGAIRKMAGGASPEDLFNEELKKAQDLATARASGASLTPAAEGANQQSYLASMDTARNMEPSTPYLKQEKAGAISSATDSLKGIYGTPTPQPSAQIPTSPQYPMPTAATGQATPKPAGAIRSLATPVASMPAAVTAPAPVEAPAIAGGIVEPAADAMKAKQYAQGVEVVRKDIEAANAIDARNAASSDVQQAAARAVLSDTSAEDKRAIQNAETSLSSITNTPAQRANAQRTIDSLNARGNARLAATNANEQNTLDRSQANQIRNQQDQTTRRGQDISAAASGAIRKLAQDKFDQESRGAAIDQQGKLQIQSLQTALLAEKDPAKRQAIEENLRAIQGKYERTAPQNKYTVYNLPDTVDANGQVIRGGQGALDADGRPIDIRPQAKPMPKAGDVVSGHKFKGGNPADQKNWEKV